MLSQVEALTGIVEENAYPQLGQRVVVATPNEIVFWPEDNQRATLRVGKKRYESMEARDKRRTRA
jgi:hypothetical protein